MTSTAVGIHTHSTKKLGVRPNDPSKPRAHLRDFLTVVPDHPLTDAAPPLTYPMDKNDEWGDCVVAGADHALQVIYTLLAGPGSWTNWTDSQILDNYRTQNKNFDPSSTTHGPGSADDGGMIIQDFLSYLVKQEVILGFAAVDPKNTEELKAAIWLGVAIITGEDLQVAQQNQTVWDYVGGSGDWGTHCTTLVGYHPSPTTVTWGELVDMTIAFIQHQMSEAWFIITKAHIEHPNFRAGFDLAKFAQAYTALTERPFPVDITDPPGPDPTPAGGDFPWAVLDPWLADPHRYALTSKAAKAIQAWRAEHPPTS